MERHLQQPAKPLENIKQKGDASGRSRLPFDFEKIFAANTCKKFLRRKNLRENTAKAKETVNQSVEM